VQELEQLPAKLEQSVSKLEHSAAATIPVSRQSFQFLFQFRLA